MSMKRNVIVTSSSVVVATSATSSHHSAVVMRGFHTMSRGCVHLPISSETAGRGSSGRESRPDPRVA
jgi:hypothetical protein